MASSEEGLTLLSAARDKESRRRAAIALAKGAFQTDVIDASIPVLLDSTAISDQLGGLELIVQLVPHDGDGDDGASRVANFANTLRQPLASNEPEVAAKAAHCLGQLARAEGGHAAVKPALDQALRRLKEGNRLDCAVLVLVQLAANAPTLTYGAPKRPSIAPFTTRHATCAWCCTCRHAVHLGEICDHLWTAMRDKVAQTRHGAAAVLRACLALIASRPGHARERWYSRVYDETLRGLSSGSPTEAVHGALLTVAELLDAHGATLSEAQLETLFECAWACRSHEKKVVRQAVLDIPPRMAAHCERSNSDAVQGGPKLNFFEEKYLQGAPRTTQCLLALTLAAANCLDTHFRVAYVCVAYVQGR